MGAGAQPVARGADGAPAGRGSQTRDARALQEKPRGGLGPAGLRAMSEIHTSSSCRAWGVLSRQVTAPGARTGKSVMRRCNPARSLGAGGPTTWQAPPPCSFKSREKWALHPHLGDEEIEAPRG